VAAGDDACAALAKLLPEVLDHHQVSVVAHARAEEDGHPIRRHTQAFISMTADFRQQPAAIAGELEELEWIIRRIAAAADVG